MAKPSKRVPVDPAKDSDRLVDEVIRSKEELRAEARERIGVTGKAEPTAPLRRTLTKYGLGLYPLAALGALSLADTFHFYAFAVLAPDLSRALGISKGAIAAVIALKTLAISVSPLPVAALVQRVPRRAFLSVLTGIIWSVAAIWTGYVTVIWGLLDALIIDGLTTGSVVSLHTPLLMDSYPPEARVRALSYYSAADSVGNVASPLLVALLSVVLALTWRGVFVVLGVVSLGACLMSIRLRDPGFGRWDEKQIRDTVLEHRAAGGTKLPEEEVSLGFFEIVRR